MLEEIHQLPVSKYQLRRGRRSTFLGLLLIFFLSSGCGEPIDLELKYQSRSIINGRPDTNPKHDAVVALTFGGGLCSGTLISPDVIITAAHCARGYSPSAFTIHFGADVNSATTRRISEVWVHPGYIAHSDGTTTNDIAMLRLDSAPPSGVTPIPCLPHSIGVNQSDVGNPMEYVGFGQTENQSVGVKLTVMNNLDWICTQPGGCTVGPGYPASQNTICEDMDPGGPCSGDSGGPAFLVRNGREYVAGLTSYGDEDCLYLGCSTKVDEFEAEIADFVGGILGSSCVDSAICLSGFCVDGVCCDSPCPAVCSVCNAPGSMGTCGPAPDGTPCLDSDKCNGAEICLLQECVAGELLDCNDDNLCTADTCDPQTGCVHEPVDDDTPCPDDDPCNGQEICQAGACVKGDRPPCDDSNPCTEDSCDSTLGCLYENLPDGTACGGDGCGPATCSAGQCQADDPLECDDEDPCTGDWCNPGEGCVRAPAEDGQACGACMICENTRCVYNQDCVLEGGCGCGSKTGSANAGLFGLILAMLALLSRGSLTVKP